MAPGEFPAPTPHGSIDKVVDGVFAVRGTFKIGAGIRISRTMTIVQQDGGLVVLNSIRLDPAGEAALRALGDVKHVVKLGDGHGIDDPYYVNSFGATFWSLEGATHPKIPRGQTLGKDGSGGGPIAGGKLLVVVGPKTPEAAYWLPNAGGTLITCDAIQNHVDKVGTSFLAKIMTPLLGFKGGVIVPSMWNKVQKVPRLELPKSHAALLENKFENLVTGHGPPVVGGAWERVRAAIGGT